MTKRGRDIGTRRLEKELICVRREDEEYAEEDREEEEDGDILMVNDAAADF